jgi:hypothetical protein
MEETMIRPQTIGELLDKSDRIEILNLFTDGTVRRLQKMGNSVLIDALTESVIVPADTVILYEPWVLDRGSLLFSTPEIQHAKLCTEFDVILYPDGSRNDIGAPESITFN